jgi:triphosphoribosyl-dephospho-CoA synthase
MQAKNSNWTARLESWIRAACLLEATARKPGNVHPEASFVDLEYADFVCSALAAGSPLAHAAEIRVGRAVFAAIEATRQRTPRNTNLGIALLIAPLAGVPADVSLREGIDTVLNALSVEDADQVYRAIRLAQPGGMGRVDDQDISEAPRVTLREAMRMAADRDAIAAQYAGRFELVLDFGVPWLASQADFASNWECRIIGLQLALMCQQPDTLIARKCGIETTREASERAQAVLEAGGPATEAGRTALATFDAWLRADGHRRNPGTTADLVAACLFAAFRDGAVPLPDLAAIHPLSQALGGRE